MEKALEIVLIGAGFYVCGGKKKDYGTVLPGILTFAKLNQIKTNIIVAINNKESAKIFSKKLTALEKILFTEQLINHEFIFCEGSPEIFLKEYKSKNKLIAGIISIPDHLHFKWANSLLNAKIPLLVVKPLTLKMNQSLELYKLSKSLSTPLFVEFHKRYDRQLRYTRDSFLKGLIGEPLYCFTEYTQKKEVPEDNFKNWAGMTNIFSYLGVHYVDAVRYITNSTPLRVCAVGQKSFLYKKQINTFDSIQCNIEWQTKDKQIFNQVILSSWVESNKATSMSKQDFHLIGTNGRIDCEQKERGIKVLTDKNPTEDINPDFTRMYSLNNSNIFEGYGIDSINNFISYIVEDKFSETDNRMCTVKESLYSTAVIEAAYHSLNKNSDWIEILSSQF